MFTYTKLPPILLTLLHSLITYTKFYSVYLKLGYSLCLLTLCYILCLHTLSYILCLFMPSTSFFYRVTSFFNLHCLCPWTTNTKWSVSSILDISPRLVAMDTYNNDVISKICLELNNKCFQFKSILNKFTPKLLHHQSLKPPNLHSGLFSFVVMVLSYLHTKHWNRHHNCLSTKINSSWKKKMKQT